MHRAYDVSFVELQLEDVVKRLNRMERDDEKAFEAVNAVSQFNQRAYELFGRPLVQALSSEQGARLQRLFHPLRWQRWAASDLNPLIWWLAPAAAAAKAVRQPLAPDHPGRRAEAMVSELTSAALDGVKALRDAFGEATFFQTYGQLYAAGVGNRPMSRTEEHPQDPRALPIVSDALARIDVGGYPEAVARVAFLMAHEDVPLPLSRLQLAHELLEDYRDLLPAQPVEVMRRVAGEQGVVARLDRDRSIDTLPALLPDPRDRQRLLALLERVIADQRVQAIQPSMQQQATLERIRNVLIPAAPEPARNRRPAKRRVAATA